MDVKDVAVAALTTEDVEETAEEPVEEPMEEDVENELEERVEEIDEVVGGGGIQDCPFPPHTLQASSLINIKDSSTNYV